MSHSRPRFFPPHSQLSVLQRALGLDPADCWPLGDGQHSAVAAATFAEPAPPPSASALMHQKLATLPDLLRYVRRSTCDCVLAIVAWQQSAAAATGNDAPYGASHASFPWTATVRDYVAKMGYDLLFVMELRHQVTERVAAAERSRICGDASNALSSDDMALLQHLLAELDVALGARTPIADNALLLPHDVCSTASAATRSSCWHVDATTVTAGVLRVRQAVKRRGTTLLCELATRVPPPSQRVAVRLDALVLAVAKSRRRRRSHGHKSGQGQGQGQGQGHERDGSFPSSGGSTRTARRRLRRRIGLANTPRRGSGSGLGIECISLSRTSAHIARERRAAEAAAAAAAAAATAMMTARSRHSMHDVDDAGTGAVGEGTDTDLGSDTDDVIGVDIHTAVWVSLVVQAATHRAVFLGSRTSRSASDDDDGDGDGDPDAAGWNDDHETDGNEWAAIVHAWRRRQDVLELARARAAAAELRRLRARHKIATACCLFALRRRERQHVAVVRIEAWWRHALGFKQRQRRHAGAAISRWLRTASARKVLFRRLACQHHARAVLGRFGRLAVTRVKQLMVRSTCTSQFRQAVPPP